MLLITIIKTIITLQHYRIRYVLSSLCFSIAHGEVFTVFGGLDCTADVETLTVQKLCRIHNTVKVPMSAVQSRPPNTVNTSP